MFASFSALSFFRFNLRRIATVVALLLLLAPLRVSLVQAAPAPASPATLPTVRTKPERPRFTPSDVNGRSSYLDESDDSSIFDNAEILAEDKKWSQAIALWDKLLKRYPNCPALVLRRSLVLRQSGFPRPALHALEKLVKEVEGKGESYYSLYYHLAETYSLCGDKSKAEQTCLAILRKFPQRSDAARGVLVLNRRIGSAKIAIEAQNRLKFLSSHPLRYDTTFSTMKLPAQQPLRSGEAYEIMVKTDCFPRFKLTMTNDRVVGDTGIVKYIIAPPNYEQIVLLNEESRNYYKTSIGELMLDHCNRRIGENHYGKVTKLGETKVLGKDCIELKCQEVDESSYEKVALSKDIALTKPLVKTICLMCGAPVSEFLPLSDVWVKEGYPTPRLTVSSIKKVKVTPAMMALNPKYHQVKNKGELIYASNGDLKDSDLDQFLQTK